MPIPDFDNMRQIAGIECECGNHLLVAPLFHEEGCRYKKIAEEAFEGKEKNNGNENSND